ncbi:MAG: 7-carboxy-7-deazaguanine synthase QueE [Tannerella sp.]|jgi:organic radical activating enzyme|nr:7-carboxy-7-deazaguanine synthase QueE [Tannerella sp.]
MRLSVREIFYSLQGEGGRMGEASIFIRLAGCNMNCPFCDTDFSGKVIMNQEEILTVIKNYPCRWIVWTGGEPCLQLNYFVTGFFKRRGYLQAIESNGTRKLPPGLDYTVISPKINIPSKTGKVMKLSQYAKLNPEVDEIRLPISEKQIPPDIALLPVSKKYFLSPIFTESDTETRHNIDWCTKYIQQNPQWQLSVQVHKLIGID